MNKIISNEKNNKKLLTKQMNSTIIIKRLERGAKKYRGVEQSVARRAHNPKVVGSNPAPAIWSIGAVVYLASLSRRRSWVQIPHGP